MTRKTAASQARQQISASDGEQTWQQTKSRLTRNSILQAAVECFHTYGYNGTTTDEIARQAGVSRGAMLHHFPSRALLVQATVAYLNQQRIEMFAIAEADAQRGAEFTRIEEGIDIYWNQLNTPVFTVFHELVVASRTDADLATAVRPALLEFQTAWYAAVKDLFPDLARSEAFARANFLTRYLLEGMVLDRNAGAQDVPEQMLLDWLKQELVRSFSDVHGSVPRQPVDE